MFSNFMDVGNSIAAAVSEALEGSGSYAWGSSSPDIRVPATRLAVEQASNYLELLGPVAIKKKREVVLMQTLVGCRFRKLAI